jgi:hypothetical protein
MTFQTLIAVVLTFSITFLSSSAAQTVSPAAAPSPVPSAPTLEESKPTRPTAPADATMGPFDNSYQEKLKARMEKGGWNVRVDVQMVTMTQVRALPLLPDLQSDEAVRVDGAIKRIQEMIARNEAKLTGWPHVVTFQDERAVSESILEKRYPIEFYPTQRPQNASPATGAIDAEEASPFPNTFETRNMGTTLEVEAWVLKDGKRIGLSLVPQRITLLNMETFAVDVAKAVRIDQPQFGSEKTTTALVVRNGERILLAVHQLYTPENEIEFFILHAAATRID